MNSTTHMHRKHKMNLMIYNANYIKNKLIKIMFKQIIDYIISIALRHKAVFFAKYLNRSYINQQNNNGYYQVNVNTDVYSQLLISVPNQPFDVTINIDILGFPTKEHTVLDCQSDALQIGIEMIHFIRQDNTFMGQLSVHDYSFLALDEFTDDRSAGQRLTLELIMPDPINLCTFMDNFLDEPKIIETEDKEIDLKDVKAPSEKNNLVLKPILIPHK